MQREAITTWEIKWSNLQIGFCLAGGFSLYTICLYLSSTCSLFSTPLAVWILGAQYLLKMKNSSPYVAFFWSALQSSSDPLIFKNKHWSLSPFFRTLHLLISSVYCLSKFLSPWAVQIGCDWMNFGPTSSSFPWNHPDPNPERPPSSLDVLQPIFSII